MFCRYSFYTFLYKTIASKYSIFFSGMFLQSIDGFNRTVYIAKQKKIQKQYMKFRAEGRTNDFLQIVIMIPLIECAFPCKGINHYHSFKGRIVSK